MSLIRPLQKLRRNERIIAIFVKGALVGGIYAMSNYLSYVRYKVQGKYVDLRYARMRQAISIVSKRKGKGFGLYIIGKFWNCVFSFCALDNAYSVRMSEILDQYTKLSCSCRKCILECKNQQKV